MNSPTRNGSAERPRPVASARSVTEVYRSAHEMNSRDRDKESFVLSWVLPHAVAVTAPPVNVAETSSWLAHLRDAGISVLVSLRPHRELTDHLVTCYHMHPVTCPVTEEEPSIETTLTLCSGLLRLLRQGHEVALHCDDALRHSTVVASALLLWTGRPFHEAAQLAPRLGRPALTGSERGFLDRFHVALQQRELASLGWSPPP